MASITKRGRRLYARVKDAKGKWCKRPSPYDAGDEVKALAWAEKLQAEIDRLRDSATSVANFAETWLAARKLRNLSSFAGDIGRIRNYVLPELGTMQIAEVRPRHVRDFVRKLRERMERGELAPRTVVHIFDIMHSMFDDAVIEELIVSNPCLLKAGEKPSKVDADPEWRALATYETSEVVQLISDPRIPVERRVQYALKALAGVRHGEVAGVRWRALLKTAIMPMLVVSTSYNRGKTKTGVARKHPVHPLLERILERWRAEHWERIYGRAPTEDDLIVPTRGFKTIAVKDANEAFKRDLRELGLRVHAGESRDRGGHDLRAWHITTLQEAGANLNVVTSWTHTKKADVISGYSRFPWSLMCAEMAKLDLVVDGDPLTVCPSDVPRDERLRNRYVKVVTPLGLEAETAPAKREASGVTLEDSVVDLASAGLDLASTGTSRVPWWMLRAEEDDSLERPPGDVPEVTPASKVPPRSRG